MVEPGSVLVVELVTVVFSEASGSLPLDALVVAFLWISGASDAFCVIEPLEVLAVAAVLVFSESTALLVVTAKGVSSTPIDAVVVLFIFTDVMF